MSKININSVIHQIPAGILPGDHSTELFGCRETKRVFAISNGKTLNFENLQPEKRAKIFEKLLSDSTAMSDLKEYSQAEAIEKYAYCIYGAADHLPDFDEDGNLKQADNFICGNDCQCLKWESKKIIINGHYLTPREIDVLTLLTSDLHDKEISQQLFISDSTLNTHKKHLFEKFDVTTKSGLITKAITTKIIQ